MRAIFVMLSAGSLLGTSCSAAGGLFGIQSPTFKLTEETKALRAAQAYGPAPLPKETAKTLLPPYIVEPGDTLLVQPADLDAPIRLPGDQPILQDGTIDLGRYGRPVVAGKSVPQIEAEVQTMVAAGLKSVDPEAAARIKGPPVTVRLIGRVSKVFYVRGEVNAPGSFPLTGRETVLDGIIAAGGLTRRASLKNIVLSRPTSPDGCRIVLQICLNEIEQQANPATNYQLMPGDRIYVASQGTLESLFGDHAGKKDCLPCDRPQVPCPLGQCNAPPAP